MRPSSFSCPHCDFEMALDPQLAGQKALCPKCKQQIEVPLSTSVPSGPASVAEYQQQIAAIQNRQPSSFRNGSASAPSVVIVQNHDPNARQLKAEDWFTRAFMSTTGVLLAAVIILLIIPMVLCTGLATFERLFERRPEEPVRQQRGQSFRRSAVRNEIANRENDFTFDFLNQQVPVDLLKKPPEIIPAQDTGMGDAMREYMKDRDQISEQWRRGELSSEEAERRIHELVAPLEKASLSEAAMARAHQVAALYFSRVFGEDVSPRVEITNWRKRDVEPFRHDGKTWTAIVTDCAVTWPRAIQPEMREFRCYVSGDDVRSDDEERDSEQVPPAL